MACLERLSPTGRKRGKSGRFVSATQKLQVIDITNTICATSSELETNLIQQVPALTSSTQESQNVKTEKTSKRRSTTSRKITKAQLTVSSPMLAPASTSRGMVSSPFWTQSKQVMSQTLWSPIKTDSLVSEKVSLNVSAENMVHHSTWFNVTMMRNSNMPKTIPPTISSKFVESSWPKTTANENLTSVEISASNSILPSKKVNSLGSLVKTAKIKLHIRNPKDMGILNNVFGVVRWTYNKSVEYAKEIGINVTKRQLRSSIINNDSMLVRSNSWLLAVGYDIRDDSMNDFITAMKGIKTKLRKGDIDHYDMKFRSKKRQKNEMFYLRRQWITQTKNALILRLPKVKKPIILWTGKNAWRGDILMDCKFQRTNTGQYYLCIPHESGVDNQDPPKNLRVCSLDPGVRTFQTIYDATSQKAYQIAPQDINRIMRLCLVLDKLISKQTSAKSRVKYRLKRVERRLRHRIRNLVDEVHKQLAKFLATTYDLVIIPKFETSQMVRKGERKIGSRSVRQMLCWSHYRFRERLIFKCREHSSKVAIVDESWTSKTCSGCGNIDHNLGAKKIYTCKKCSMVMDRDINGAKNILLKNYEALTLTVDIGAYPLDDRDVVVNRTR